MNVQSSVQVVVFDTDDARLRQLEDAARHLDCVVDCVEFVGGTGPAVTKKAKLDAMLVTPMQAERFGIGPPFPLAQARVHEARASDVDAGFPRHFVVGVALASVSKPRDWNGELRLFLRAAADAVRTFNTQTFEGRIRRVGVAADSLLAGKMRPEDTIAAIAETFGTG